MAKVEVIVTLKKSLNDAQGEVVRKALHNLGYDKVMQVRVGKYIEVEVDGDSPQTVEAQVREMAEKLLSNPIIEDYVVKSISGPMREPPHVP